MQGYQLPSRRNKLYIMLRKLRAKQAVAYNSDLNVEEITLTFVKALWNTGNSFPPLHGNAFDDVSCRADNYDYLWEDVDMCKAKHFYKKHRADLPHGTFKFVRDKDGNLEAIEGNPNPWGRGNGNRNVEGLDYLSYPVVTLYKVYHTQSGRLYWISHQAQVQYYDKTESLELVA